MNASKLCHALKHCFGHEFGWEIIGDLIRWERMKALIFDLDGTLVDFVYVHVLAWQVAFAEAGMPIDGWRLHRRMGMSGGLFKRAVVRELGRTISLPKLQALDKRHGEFFHKFLPHPRPLPGAVQLLRFLRKSRVIHGVATSNQRPHINASLKGFGTRRRGFAAALFVRERGGRVRLVIVSGEFRCGGRYAGGDF
jgi:phosphoglycolate phosphatase-like HAD superfamily hydrolase